MFNVLFFSVAKFLQRTLKAMSCFAVIELTFFGGIDYFISRAGKTHTHTQAHTNTICSCVQ